MKRYEVTIHCEDIVVIVLAEDKEDAIQKYFDDEIEEEITGIEQPEFSAKLEI